jgi:hypothetical protein
MFFSIKYPTLTSGKYLEFPKNLLDLLRLLLSSVAWRAARVAYLLLVHQAGLGVLSALEGYSNTDFF